MKKIVLSLLSLICFVSIANSSSNGISVFTSNSDRLNGQKASYYLSTGTAGTTYATQATVNAIAVSTGNIQTQVNNIAVSTGNIQTQVNNIAVSTGNIQTQVNNIAISTGNIQSATKSFKVWISTPFYNLGTSTFSACSIDFPYAVTITTITARIYGSGTNAVVNLTIRDKNLLEAQSGTNILTGNITAIGNAFTGGTFATTAVPANSGIYVTGISYSGDVGALEISCNYHE